MWSRCNGYNLLLQDGPTVMGSPTNCRVYATLREPGVARSETVCGGPQRERHVYLSTANVVEIRVVGQDNADTSQYFMLKYRGQYLHTDARLQYLHC